MCIRDSYCFTHAYVHSFISGGTVQQKVEELNIMGKMDKLSKISICGIIHTTLKIKLDQNPKLNFISLRQDLLCCMSHESPCYFPLPHETKML